MRITHGTCAAGSGKIRSGGGAPLARGMELLYLRLPKGNHCQVGWSRFSPSVDLSRVLKSAVWSLLHSCEPCVPCLLVLCITYRNTVSIYYIVKWK